MLRGCVCKTTMVVGPFLGGIVVVISTLLHGTLLLSERNYGRFVLAYH